MIDKLAMSNEQLAIRTQNTEHRQQTEVKKIRSWEGKNSITSQSPDLELKKVAKDMEALFAYQLIKVMRETSNSISSEKGFGYNTYMSLFDMELSRLLAEKGLGLQDVLVRELGRIQAKTDIQPLEKSVSVSD